METYRNILVPLDGSELAECALPHAIKIAKAFSAEVVLVSVTEAKQGFIVVNDPSQSSEQRLIPEGTGKLEEQAQNYLAKIVKRITTEGVTVATDVEYGNPADGILASAQLYNCDLIVMSSHGRSGPSKRTHGSVAEKIFRASTVPVLMVRAPNCGPVSD
jgi:nucleotide-binding universal stress UspA family protein